MSRTKRGAGQRRATRQKYDSPADGYVSFYCDGSSSSAHPKWRICSFIRDAEDGSWTLNGSRYIDPADAQQIPVAGHPTQRLVGDQWIATDDKSYGIDAQVRSRLKLKCPHCGLSRAFADLKALVPTLIALNSNRVLEVELSHLISAQIASD